MKRDPIYGIMAEFDSGAGAHRRRPSHTHQAGYQKIDAYSPFPVEGLAEEIGFHHDEVPLVVLIGGIVGGLTGYLMQYWMSAVDYPINVGGKPYHSWPAFIVITFEMTILFAGISAVFGMLALNGLPMPYHPVFNVPQVLHSASKDRFFLIVFSTDKKYDPIRYHAPVSRGPSAHARFRRCPAKCGIFRKLSGLAGNARRPSNVHVGAPSLGAFCARVGFERSSCISCLPL
jgi:hypothetical protein